MTSTEASTGQHLRTLMSRVPTAVTVITTVTPTGHDARTASSFTSVSLAPPLVSVCFDLRSPFVAAVRAAGRWGVSILAADQAHLSTHFARPGQRRLDHIPHQYGRLTGAALLEHAVVTMECRSVQYQHAGDHVVMVGEVLDMTLERDTPALIYYAGTYHPADW